MEEDVLRALERLVASIQVAKSEPRTDRDITHRWASSMALCFARRVDASNQRASKRWARRTGSKFIMRDLRFLVSESIDILTSAAAPDGDKIPHCFLIPSSRRWRAVPRMR